MSGSNKSDISSLKQVQTSNSLRQVQTQCLKSLKVTARKKTIRIQPDTWTDDFPFVKAMLNVSHILLLHEPVSDKLCTVMSRQHGSFVIIKPIVAGPI